MISKFLLFFRERRLDKMEQLIAANQRRAEILRDGMHGEVYLFQIDQLAKVEAHLAALKIEREQIKKKLLIP